MSEVYRLGPSRKLSRIVGVTVAYWESRQALRGLGALRSPLAVTFCAGGSLF